MFRRGRRLALTQALENACTQTCLSHRNVARLWPCQPRGFGPHQARTHVRAHYTGFRRSFRRTTITSTTSRRCFVDVCARTRTHANTRKPHQQAPRRVAPASSHFNSPLTSFEATTVTASACCHRTLLFSLSAEFIPFKHFSILLLTLRDHIHTSTFTSNYTPTCISERPPCSSRKSHCAPTLNSSLVLESLNFFACLSYVHTNQLQSSNAIYKSWTMCFLHADD